MLASEARPRTCTTKQKERLRFLQTFPLYFPVVHLKFGRFQTQEI
jgi:hypothetical protein